MLCVLFTPNIVQAGDHHALLKAEFPVLDALYQRYSAYQPRLATFAIQQGFIEPAEVLATVVHELIHVDSAANQGFFIGGGYAAPYVAHSSWPYLNNRDVVNYLTPKDRTSLGPIHGAYMLNSPLNRLGNVLDEVNAYAQTIPFLCIASPSRAPTHIQAMNGHLVLVDAYLRILSQRFPDQYQKLAANRVSRGALETIVASAYQSLNACHARGVAGGDPSLVPKTATQDFAAMPLPH